MREAITRIIISKYLIGAIYTIPGCDQSVKCVVGVGRGILASHPSCCTEWIIANFRLVVLAWAETVQ